jgi:transcriptional regulator with XRE-family HTH domain
MNLIAEKIKNGRIKASMSEKILAKKCGLSEKYIKQIESGKKVINEQSAQKIFKVLGVDADLLQQGSNISRSDIQSVRSIKAKNEELSAKKENVTVEPNDQWADGLAHIIKQYPVTDLSTGKAVGLKEIPVLGKKIEGCSWNKIKYYRVSDDILAHLRVKKDDVVMICESDEVINGKLMLIEVGGRRILRKIWQDNKKMHISTGAKNEEPIQHNADRVQILGQCIKVEFRL